MKRTDLHKRFQTLLADSNYVTIATVCSDGQPWNTPVVGRFDYNLNLYWVSWIESRHSRNIARDPRIFVVVYDSHAPDGQGEGLYLRMTALSLERQHEIAQALRVYDASFFACDDGSLPDFMNDCPSRMYKATLQELWRNDVLRKDGHCLDIRLPVSGS